jgi:hypothetical protein
LWYKIEGDNALINGESSKEKRFTNKFFVKHPNDSKPPLLTKTTTLARMDIKKFTSTFYDCNAIDYYKMNSLLFP